MTQTLDEQRGENSNEKQSLGCLALFDAGVSVICHHFACKYMAFYY